MTTANTNGDFSRMLRRGRDVCHVQGTLLQDGKEVATAVAVCKIVSV